uniref:Death domain-containing protein n=1 Tax=Timema shepardi TaxID=629360 RepID=A0A7R9FVS1_TIMSH|nr:unnamed protein product [Timema shepardi]
MDSPNPKKGPISPVVPEIRLGVDGSQNWLGEEIFLGKLSPEDGSHNPSGSRDASEEGKWLKGFRGADMLELEEEFVVRKARRCPRSTRPHSMSQAVIGRGLRTIAAPAFSADGGVGHPDLLLSNRRLQDVDVRLVAEQMGASWHLLGLRLNFSPETLDLIQTSGNNSGADVTNKMAMMMLRAWSQLPTATVGRLATVLWEMGEHAIALQLNP